MPSIQDMLRPPEPIPCPNHPNYVVERFGVCCVCEMTTHRHVSGFRLLAVDDRQMTFRSEADAYGEGIEDDD